MLYIFFLFRFEIIELVEICGPMNRIRYLCLGSFRRVYRLQTYVYNFMYMVISYSYIKIIIYLCIKKVGSQENKLNDTKVILKANS